MSVLKMSDLDLSGKRVLIREDLNVPIKDGKVASDARLRASLPTIQQALAAGASVIVMSHLGRPKEGEFDAQFSMAPVADWLADALGKVLGAERGGRRVHRRDGLHRDGHRHRDDRLHGDGLGDGNVVLLVVWHDGSHCYRCSC